MKVLLLFLSFLGISFISYGQETKCKSVHKGTFRLADLDTTIIERTSDTQLEINSNLGVRMLYYLTWINDCTYELRLKKLIEGDPKFALKEGAVLTVEIKLVKEKSYTSETRSNFSNLVVKSEIEIMK